MAEIVKVSEMSRQDKIVEFSKMTTLMTNAIKDERSSEKVKRYSQLAIDIYEMGSEVGIAESEDLHNRFNDLESELDEIARTDGKVLEAMANIGSAKLVYLR